MNQLHVYADGDSIPVVPQLIKLSGQLGFKLVLVHSHAHTRASLPDSVKTIIVDQGADAADFRMISESAAGDIAVTDDLGLASILSARGVYVIHSNGIRFREEAADAVLEWRHAKKEARRRGNYGKGPSKRKRTADSQFEVQFIQLFEALKEGGDKG
ncbi:DUF188 domain-containing protein [Alkalicoccus luteus]|uniref:Uncharacterized protein n=1 Tax=Alkalicoccus luteus TaxID=1237094 RepID=A0A969PNY9_9BACI|nr:DUF188 domain-containing protein [Alkalicoccus luteus]NJP37707.1 hypothetical protein [Alkalicoccus luteus]